MATVDTSIQEFGGRQPIVFDEPTVVLAGHTRLEPRRAARRRAPSDTAFPHRTAAFSVLILAQWQDPAATDANIAWARDTNARLMPHAVTGGYSIYLGDDEPPGPEQASLCRELRAHTTIA